MKKWIIIILLMIMMPLVVADMCEDRVYQDCTMITPTILCNTYNYSIYTKEGALVTEDNLTQLSGQIYSFHFNESEGAYIVELCEGSTREIFMGGGTDMYIAIIIGIIGAVFMLFYLGNSLNKEHASIKLLLFITGLFILLGGLAVSNNIATDSLESITGGSYTGLLWVIMFIVAYFLIYYIFNITKSIRTKKYD